MSSTVIDLGVGDAITLAPGTTVIADQGTVPWVVSGTVTEEQKGFSNVTAGFPTQIAVAASSTILLPANPLRVYAHISNNSGVPVYIQYSANALVGQGIKLNNTSVLFISGSELWLGEINAVSTAGTVNIDVFEGVY